MRYPPQQKFCGASMKTNYQQKSLYNPQLKIQHFHVEWLYLLDSCINKFTTLFMTYSTTEFFWNSIAIRNINTSRNVYLKNIYFHYSMKQDIPIVILQLTTALTAIPQYSDDHLIGNLIQIHLKISILSNLFVPW